MSVKLKLSDIEVRYPLPISPLRSAETALKDYLGEADPVINKTTADELIVRRSDFRNGTLLFRVGSWKRK